MTYAKSIVIAAALIASSILLSKIAVSQQTVDTSNRPVLNIALAQAVEESSAMQDRASWVWVMQGNKLYACRITLKPDRTTESKNSPECTDPTEFN